MLNPEKMLYQGNKIGSNLVIIFILINMFFTIMTLKYMPMGMSIGSFTLFNIVLSLGAFLGSTKFMVYDATWAYVGLVFSIIQCSRILNINETFVGSFRIMLIISLLISAVSLLAGSIITIRKSKLKLEYEQSLNSQAN